MKREDFYQTVLPPLGFTIALFAFWQIICKRGSIIFWAMLIASKSLSKAMSLQLDPICSNKALL